MVDLINFFAGRKLVIATKHKKELVIGPPLKAAFGLDYFSSEGLDRRQVVSSLAYWVVLPCTKNLKVVIKMTAKKLI